MNSKFLAAMAIVLTMPAWSAETAKPQPAAQATPAQPTDEQVVAEFRKEMAARRADVMAKGLTLSSDQAAKFWPLFEQFQKEQDVLVQDQIAATDHYAQNYQNLSDK